MRGFYFISNQGLSRRGSLHDVTVAAQQGCCLIQYRPEPGTDRVLLEEARRLQSRAGEVPFIVNNRVDLALALGAAGVHLGQHDLDVATARRLLGPKAIIGVSVSTEDQARRAEAEGASYIAVSPVFASATKANAGQGLGLRRIGSLRAITRLPVAAIGGLDLERARQCVAEGADMVCAISATVSAPDLAAAIAQFKELFL